MANLPLKQRDSIEKQLQRVKTEDVDKILGVLNRAMERQELQNPAGYLAGIIRKYQAGEFSLPQERTDKQQEAVAELRDKQAIEQCPLCNDRGRFEGYIQKPDKGTSEVFTLRCRHDLEKFWKFVRKYPVTEVFSAQDEYSS